MTDRAAVSNRPGAEGGWARWGMAAAVVVLAACRGGVPESGPTPRLEHADTVLAYCPLPLARSRGLPPVPVRLRLQNSTDRALTVYLDRCDGHVRLGTVRGEGAAVFRLPRFLIPVQDGLRIHAYLENEDHRYGSFVIPLDTVPLLHFELSDSSSQVAYGGVPILGIPEFGSGGDSTKTAGEPSYTVSFRPSSRRGGTIPGTFDRTTRQARPRRRVQLGGSVETPMATAFTEDLDAVVTWMCYEGSARLTLFARDLTTDSASVSVELPDGGVRPVEGWRTEVTMRPTLVLAGAPLSRLMEEMRDAPEAAFLVDTDKGSVPRWEFSLDGLDEALSFLDCFAPQSRLGRLE